MKTNYPLLLAILFFINSCSKSSQSNKIDITNESPFHSLELGNHFDKHLPEQSLQQLDFDHYLVMYRFKTFDHPEEAFTKIVYGESLQDHLALSVATTHLSATGNIVSYTFSNDWFPVFIDGVESNRLDENLFTSIPFSFKVGDEIEIEGHFPDPGSLSETSFPNIRQLSKSLGQTLSWSPSIYPGAKVNITIVHLSTTGTELQTVKELVVNDTGSFNLDANQLQSYKTGDQISISMIRDIYLQQDNILVRGVEEQAWSFVTIVD